MPTPHLRANLFHTNGPKCHRPPPPRLDLPCLESEAAESLAAPQDDVVLVGPREERLGGAPHHQDGHAPPVRVPQNVGDALWRRRNGAWNSIWICTVAGGK